MPVRKIKTTEQTKLVLVRPRAVIKKELEAIIDVGQAYYDTPITTPDELTKLNGEFADWDHYNTELLKRMFNNPTNEYFIKYSRMNEMLGLGDYLSGVNTNTIQYKINTLKYSIENCITFLKRFITTLHLIDEDGSLPVFSTKEKQFFNRGFLIHGHDQTRKFEVARFIENDLGRKIIILHEQPNKGRTIIEKFEDYSGVDFAVALWTADDVGNTKIHTSLNNRARQNVVLETGFFIGKIGRENLIVLHETGVEIPSDYSGVIFISLTDNWKDDLRKEIETIYQADI